MRQRKQRVSQIFYSPVLDCFTVIHGVIESDDGRDALAVEWSPNDMYLANMYLTLQHFPAGETVFSIGKFEYMCDL